MKSARAHFPTTPQGFICSHGVPVGDVQGKVSPATAAPAPHLPPSVHPSVTVYRLSLLFTQLVVVHF